MGGSVVLEKRIEKVVDRFDQRKKGSYNLNRICKIRFSSWPQVIKRPNTECWAVLLFFLLLYFINDSVNELSITFAIVNLKGKKGNNLSVAMLHDIPAEIATFAF